MSNNVSVVKAVKVGHERQRNSLLLLLPSLVPAAATVIALFLYLLQNLLWRVFAGWKCIKLPISTRLFIRIVV